MFLKVSTRNQQKKWLGRAWSHVMAQDQITQTNKDCSQCTCPNMQNVIWLLDLISFYPQHWLISKTFPPKRKGKSMVPFFLYPWTTFCFFFYLLHITRHQFSLSIPFTWTSLCTRCFYFSNEVYEECMLINFFS